jgi:hypothetical protein
VAREVQRQARDAGIPEALLGPVFPGGKSGGARDAGAAKQESSFA